MINNINETTDFLKQKLKGTPSIGMITGTGLGDMTERLEIDFRIPFKEIPYFPTSTVSGHQGNLVSGSLSGKRLLVMEGRFHLYEGYDPLEVTYPVRIMSKFGVKYLLISSAAGGLNPLFNVGDLMIVSDQINLTGINPLTGPNLDEFGPRFPDMSRVYDPELIDIVRKKAIRQQIDLRQGVYLGITGPSLETPAEIRFMRMIGADAVGMSTVSEVIVGVHCGLKIIAIMVITDMNLPDCMEEISVEKVIATANAASPILTDLWEAVIDELD